MGVRTLASEDKIALFYIATHDGSTPEELVAPSLCRIIELAAFVKTAVNILPTDFKRLQWWFGLRPQRAVKLTVSSLRRAAGAARQLYDQGVFAGEASQVPSGPAA